MTKERSTLGGKPWLALALVFLVLFGLYNFVQANKAKELAEENAKKAIEKAKEVEAARQAQERKLVEEKAAREVEAKRAAEEKAKVSAEKAKLEAELQSAKDEIYALRVENNKLPSEQEQELSSNDVVHVEDDLELGASVPVVLLGDTKLKKLFDGEIVFDGDKYDVEESVEFSGLSLPLGEDEYKGEAFVEVSEGGVKYKVQFESGLPTNDISEDETLEVPFLGEKLIVKEWSGSKITFTSGEELVFKEGDVKAINGKELKVTFIGENDDVVVSYGGITKTMKEGQVKTINGLDIFVDEVLSNSRSGVVTLKVGKDVEETVDDGDEYESDKKWTWVVDESTKTLGLVLEEEFRGFETGEEFNALSYKQVFKLPKDRIVMTFVGLDKVEYTKIDMDLDKKDSILYVRLVGEFEKGLETYKKLYVEIGGSHIYGLDENNDLELLGDKVLVKDSEFEIYNHLGAVKVVDKGTSVERAKFLKDFSQSTLDGSVLTGDENHLSSVGIRVENVEDADEDEEFKFSVPEERVFATLTFQ